MSKWIFPLRGGVSIQLEVIVLQNLVKQKDALTKRLLYPFTRIEGGLKTWGLAINPKIFLEVIYRQMHAFL
jgi:hypothetical protein